MPIFKTILHRSRAVYYARSAYYARLVYSARVAANREPELLLVDSGDRTLVPVDRFPLIKGHA